ncbi:MAG: metallophosphoesterase [Deltaproteobacteria bacterium]|nr:metallophosphoesterase [Deltaproteobacteria bacterium]
MGSLLRAACGTPAALVAALLLGVSPAPAEQGRGAAVRAGTPSGVELRAPAEREGFSFLVFGDRTAGRPAGLPVLERAVALSNRLGGHFVMTVGDMVQGYTGEAAWLEQMREYKQIMSALEVPWYPAVGNHDVYPPRRGEGNIALYQEHFGPLYYSFDYKWAHFVVLFTDEKLSFAIPPLHQNMSEEQMRWLRGDLAASDAQQVFVFLHHPRWTYPGTNWDEVHGILATDGRVQAVMAGHVHEYRDDGLRDGIHYYAMAVTGGNRTRLHDSASLHHVNQVIVSRDGYAMSVLPVEPDDPRPSPLPGDFALGSEVDAMNRLLDERWLGAEGAVEVDPAGERGSEVFVTIRNTTDRSLGYAVSLTSSSQWQVEPEKLQGEVAPGEMGRQVVKVRSSGWAPGTRASLRADAELRYPLRSGLVEAIPSSLELPLSIPGLARLAGARTEHNQVLVLDGSSAVRLNLVEALPKLEAFTLEAWARGSESSARQAIASNTHASSFGIFWRALGDPKPRGLVSFQGPGYTQVGDRDVPPDKWTHFALVHDGELLRLYVDGRLAGKSHKPVLKNFNELPFFVGAEPSALGLPRNFFSGAVDEVRLSSVARYADSFVPAYHHERDPETLLLLHFDADSGGVFPDDSGREHHGWAMGKAHLAPEIR